MSSLDVAAYNLKGQVFCGANTAETTISVATTAQTGLILYNPNGSGKNFLLVDFCFAFTTVPGAVHNIGLALVTPSIVVPSSTGVTTCSAVLSASGQVATGTSVARLYSAATFTPASVAVRWSFGSAYGTAVGVSPACFKDVVDGAIMLAPGAAVTVVRVTTASLGMASFTWIEVPV